MSSHLGERNGLNTTRIRVEKGTGEARDFRVHTTIAEDLSLVLSTDVGRSCL